MMIKVHIPHRPVDIGYFLLLAFLCYQGHQAVRHLTGGVLCGGLGSMTFTIATTRHPRALPTLMTLSGPLFTFGLEWLGMLLLRWPRRAAFAYALIFASFAPLRAIQTLSGRGDELVLAQQWFAAPSRVAVAAVVLLIVGGAVVAAYRAIANPRPLPVLLGALLLPLPLLFAMLFGNVFLFGQDGIPAGQMLIFGVAPIVLVVDLLALGVWVLLSRVRAPARGSVSIA